MKECLKLKPCSDIDNIYICLFEKSELSEIVKLIKSNETSILAANLIRKKMTDMCITDEDFIMHQIVVFECTDTFLRVILDNEQDVLTFDIVYKKYSSRLVASRLFVGGKNTPKGSIYMHDPVLYNEIIRILDK